MRTRDEIAEDLELANGLLAEILRNIAGTRGGDGSGLSFHRKDGSAFTLDELADGIRNLI